jgi:hypothetical protein
VGQGGRKQVRTSLSIEVVLVQVEGVGESGAQPPAVRGFDLVSFREVRLPLYRLNVAATVLAEQPLPEMQAFVLRTNDAGLESIEDVTGFLGLAEGDLDDVLFTLSAERLIRLRHEPALATERLGLTEAGVRAAESLRMIQTLERTFVLDFDGLLRRPVPRRGWAVRPRRLRELSEVEIAPSPPRRPAVEDIDLAGAEVALRETRDLAKAHRLLELIRVNRADTLFLPAALLVFQAKVGDEAQASFVIDGRLSDAHELAFAAAQGPERLGRRQETPGLPRRLARFSVTSEQRTRDRLSRVGRPLRARFRTGGGGRGANRGRAPGHDRSCAPGLRARRDVRASTSPRTVAGDDAKAARSASRTSSW